MALSQNKVRMLVGSQAKYEIKNLKDILLQDNTILLKAFKNINLYSHKNLQLFMKPELWRG